MTPPGRGTRTISVDRAVRVGEAVQPGERRDQVDRGVREREVADVGDERRRPGERCRAVGPSPGPVEHGGGDVRGDVVEPLARGDAPHRDAVAGGHVEHPRPGGQPPDLAHGVVQETEVAAEAEPPGHSPDAPVLHEPAVDAGPQAGPRATRRRSLMSPGSPRDRSISRGTPKRVDEVEGQRPDLAAQVVDLAADRLGPGRGEPAVLHEPGAVGLDRGERVQVAEQVEGDLGVAVGQGAGLLTKASSTRRSTCARAAPITWSWTREKTSPGFIPWSMPRLSRRATPPSMCSSRKRSIACW